MGWASHNIEVLRMGPIDRRLAGVCNPFCGSGGLLHGNLAVQVAKNNLKGFMVLPLIGQSVSLEGHPAFGEMRLRRTFPANRSG